MKTFILFAFLALSSIIFGQKQKDFKLDNVLVIGQIDNVEDRYSVEVNMTQLLKSYGVNAMPAMNIVKTGQDAVILASDSMQQMLKTKGIDTYCLVSIRGYDRNFSISGNQAKFEEALKAGSLVDLYQLDIVSISFEFKFYRNGEFVHGQIMKCSSVSDRSAVLKKFRSKLEKQVKKWIKK